MPLHSISSIICRELGKLKRELEAYESEAMIWQTPAGITNSAGNLALHLVGNLKHFIGANLGNSGYIRDRKAEFEQKNVPLPELLQALDETSVVVQKSLAALDAHVLSQTYPEQVFSEPVSTLHWLIHLISHLSYHLGQVNYHRRVSTGKQK